MILTAAHADAAGLLTGSEQPGHPAAALHSAMRDLDAVGLVRQRGGKGAGLRLEDDVRLLKLLRQLDVQVELKPSFDRQLWFAFSNFAALRAERALAADGDFPHVGKGYDAASAARGCLGELAEQESWRYRPSDSELRSASHDRTEEGREHAWAVSGARWQAAGWPDISGMAAVPIDWVRMHQLGAQSNDEMVPAFLCFGGYADVTGIAAHELRNDNNGCASGPSLEHAKLTALLELVERDATGIWWYGQCKRSAYIPIGDPDLRRVIDARDENRPVWFLDLVTDLEVPVIAAVSTTAQRLDPALGVAARATREAAARAAYLELAQMELNLALVRYRARKARQNGTQPNANDAELLAWYDDANETDLPHLIPASSNEAARPAQPMADLLPEGQIDWLSTRLQRAGLAAYWRDLTRPELAVPVARVLAPGLAHFKQGRTGKRVTSLSRFLGGNPTGNLLALPLKI